MVRILFAAFLLISGQQAFAGETGCVYELSGAVHMLKAGAAAQRPALKGEAVAEGDRLSTGESAWCELLLKDGTFVRLEPGSETVLEDLRATAQERAFTFSFLKGKALWMAAKLKKKINSKFTIRTPSAVCAVRGTDFSTIVSTAGATELGLFEGEISVANDKGERVIQAGSQVSAAAGAAPEQKDKFTPAMRAEERRYQKLKNRVEGLRRRLEQREDFIDDYVGRQAKALSDRDQRLKEKLNRR